MGETSCREDELRMKRSNDEDDDPSAAKDSEQPSSTSKQTGVQATAQGESSKVAEGSGSGKGVMEGEDTIEALLDLDDLLLGNEEEEEGEFCQLKLKIGIQTTKCCLIWKKT